MKLSPVRCLVASSIIVAGSAANAQSREPGWDFGGDVIYQNAELIDADGGSSASLGANWGLTTYFGYRFNPHLELQFALDWQDIDFKAKLVRADPTTSHPISPAVEVNADGSMQTFTPRVIGNYNFLNGPITPYLTGALGWSFIDTNIPQGLPQTFCWWDPWWGYVCSPYQSTHNTDGAVYDFGAGLRWDLSSGYTVRMAYEKHWLDLRHATSTPSFDQFKLGVGFRF